MTYSLGCSAVFEILSRVRVAFHSFDLQLRCLFIPIYPSPINELSSWLCRRIMELFLADDSCSLGSGSYRISTVKIFAARSSPFLNNRLLGCGQRPAFPSRQDTDASTPSCKEGNSARTLVIICWQLIMTIVFLHHKAGRGVGPCLRI